MAPEVRGRSSRRSSASELLHCPLACMRQAADPFSPVNPADAPRRLARAKQKRPRRVGKVRTGDIRSTGGKPPWRRAIRLQSGRYVSMHVRSKLDLAGKCFGTPICTALSHEAEAAAKFIIPTSLRFYGLAKT